MANLLSNPFYLISPLVGFAISISLFVLVLIKDHRKWTNRLFSVVLLNVGLWSIFLFAMRASPNTESALFWERILFPTGVAQFIFYYHFTCLYVRKTEMKLLWIAYSLLILTYILSANGLTISHMTLESFGYAPHLLTASYAISVIGSLFLVMAFRNLVNAYRDATRYIEKTRVTYMIIALSVLFIFLLIDAFPNHLPMGIIGNTLFAIIMVIAILKYHLLDIHVAMRKGLAYLLTSAAVAFIYVGILLLLHLRIGDANVPIWVHAAILVLLSFVLRPLLQGIQEQIDRWFYRERYDFLQEMERFRRDSHDITDVQELGSTILKLISQALHVGSIQLLLRAESDNFQTSVSTGDEDIKLSIRGDSPILKWLHENNTLLYWQSVDMIPYLQSLSKMERDQFERTGAALFVPFITKKNELVGVLILGKKLSQQPYSREDERLIDAIANRFTMEIENARLYSNALRRSANIEAWLNGMNDSVIITGPDHTLQFMNRTAKQRFGTGKGNIIGPYLQNRREYNNIGGYLRYRVQVDGGEYEILSAPFLDSSNIMCHIHVLRDMTEIVEAAKEKKELEYKAQLASRLATVGEMASGIAHEINNPLTGVIGFTQLLSTSNLPETSKRYVEVINSSAQQVASVVRRLLTFARQQKPERGVVDINKIVETSLELRNYSLKTSNIDVTTQLDHDLPQTMADASQLQQVFLNIIINAEMEMKLAHGKGNLLIKTESGDSTILISFEDNGPGIAEENLYKIFSPFFTTRQTGMGTGLGLSVCHGIIAEHQGRINVESKLGKGAIFKIELPIITDLVQTRGTEMNYTESNNLKAKILVVDDELVIRELLTHLLKNKGYEVDTVDNGNDALEKLNRIDYDLVLLDIKLPGKSGIELYGDIEGINQDLAKKVVFITGDVMGLDTEDFLGKTEIPRIMKPFDIHKLSGEIETYINKNRINNSETIKRK
ncbi:ATP-binding protein [Chloroflexota bacterium]